MKQTKKVFAYFVPFDTTGIQAFLEKQARKGWMLEKTGGAIWTFRRIEPKSVHFSVVFFPNASAFDPAPSEAQQSFFDFCEHTGWKLASSDGKRQIFYNEAADPTPIETDAALEVDTIHRAAKKDYLPSCLAFLAMLLIEFVAEFRYMCTNPIGILSSNVSLLVGIDTIVTAVLLGIEIGSYFLWYHRARAAAERGVFQAPPSSLARRLTLIFLTYTILSMVVWQTSSGKGSSGTTLVALAMLAGIGLIAALLLGVSNWMKRKQFSAKRNRTVTVILSVVCGWLCIVGTVIGVVSLGSSAEAAEKPVETYEYQGKRFEIYRDELPLTVEELMDSDYDGYSYLAEDVQESILLKYEEAAQKSRVDALTEPQLFYSVTTVKTPLVYGLCKEAALDDVSTLSGFPRPNDEGELLDQFVPTDPGPWKAREAYQRVFDGEKKTWFVLCYDSRIVRIIFEGDAWSLTDAQMALVGEKLGK